MFIEFNVVFLDFTLLNLPIIFCAILLHHTGLLLVHYCVLISELSLERRYALGNHIASLLTTIMHG